MSYSSEKPWIKEREYSLVCWVPERVRGEFFNLRSNRLSDILRASDEKIDSYVKMMSELGFTGIQILDTCSLWDAFGSIDATHQQLKKFAGAAKKYGQNVTLWVWAACFTGYGWTDPDADYNFGTPNVYDTPKYFNMFSRYYDKYADLAELADRLIFHFYDPGDVGDIKDVIKFVKLLESKCLKKNPNLKFGVDTWAAPDGYIDNLVSSGLDDHMLLELSFIPTWPEGQRKKYRQNAIDKGFKLGVWGWYTAEYETDQFATMSVNAKVLKDVYNRIRNEADEVIVPEYWSEMEATHVINIFTMYCAAQLLIDPDRDADELLYEISEKFLPSKKKEIFQMLSLIQDARSGDKWEKYWWSYPEYILKNENNWQSINERAIEVEKFLIENRNNYELKSELTLPYDVCEILEAILPHIRQIKAFSDFRVKFDALKAEADDLNKEELFSRLDALYQPVPDYDTWVGTFGQPEQRIQMRFIEDFCKQYDIQIPFKGDLVSDWVRRILDKMYLFQKYNAERSVFNVPFIHGGNLGITETVAYQVLEALKTIGAVEMLSDDTFCLVNWQNYSLKV